MTELLAPAGSLEAFTAALESGADAVYLGGRLFGARHYAPNFSDEELAAVVRDAHLRSVAVYVTVNTLLDDSEIPELVSYLQHLYTIGVDAIIVQDMGVAQIARTVTPQLPLHGSTQMTVHNLAGVEFLAGQGFTRVVLARELSLEDIRFICRRSPIEIEAFIHGALCISYSGQCLMSSMIGGRSGNRGKCAQPCRLPYRLVDEAGNKVLAPEAAGEYLLSPKDLCTIELLSELIEAGVVSFKIEGRMKRAEYVAVVVDSYRRAIDGYYATKARYLVPPEDIKNMAQTFNRGFTTAYLKNRPGQLMMSDRRPNNRGMLIGRVAAYSPESKTAVVKLDEALAVGDTIEFWVKVGGRTNVTVSTIMLDGLPTDYASAGSEAAVPVPAPVRPGDRVFKTFDYRLMEKARAFFTGASPARRVPVKIAVDASEGEPLTITMRDADGCVGRGETVFRAEKALKRPLDYEMVAKQVSRLGNTVFSVEKLDCTINGSLMVPISELNEARRQAVQSLIAVRLARYARSPLVGGKELTGSFAARPSSNPVSAKPLLVVNVDTVEKAETALVNGADVVMFGGESYTHAPLTANDYRQVVAMARARGKAVVLSTPRIVSQQQIRLLTAELELFAELAPDLVSAANIGTIHLMRNYSTLNISGDFPLNVYNSVAVSFYASLGLTALTLSPELNFEQIGALASRADIDLECLVHGYLPLMISEYCAIGSFIGGLHKGRCTAACREERYWLKDRKDEKFPLVTDQFCRMHVLNAKELSMLPHVAKFGRLGIRRLRVEGKATDKPHLAKITRLYRELIDQGDDHPLLKNDGFKELEQGGITRGHYFRGVL